jgi:SWIM/SEC-C metal-binding protein
MARLGTKKHPAILRVQDEQRALEVFELCQAHGIECIVGVEPEEPEDISDIERALNPPAPAIAPVKPGRNDPCLCGSGVKFKRCCA